MAFTIYDKVQNYISDPKYGTAPHQRSILDLLDSGIINIDKPANPTSHEVTAWVKQILRINKAGHGGTLDPAVTGCLPIALGRATRALQVLLLAGKEYICVMRTHGSIAEEKLASILDNFRGKIYQTPPLRSNVKRRLRVRKIYELELCEHTDSHLSLLRIKCEAGTYIRKLIFDIGLLLGTGAHMAELRRTKTGPFTEDTCVTLQDLRDAWYYYETEKDDSFISQIIQPIENITANLPKIYIRDSAIDAICHGASLTLPGVVRVTGGIDKSSTVAILSMKDELVAFARSELTTKKIVNKDNGICAKPYAVFMKKNTYPSSWKTP